MHAFDRPMPDDLRQAPLHSFLQSADADALAFRQDRLRSFVEPEIHDTFAALDALGEELHAEQRLSAARGAQQHRDRTRADASAQHRVEFADAERKLRARRDLLLA